MRRFLPFAALVGLGLVRATGQDLNVGSNTPNNTLEITNGTNAYVNTYIGIVGGSDNNTLGVFNAGTLLTNSGALYVGDAGSGNRLVITNGGTVANTTGIIGYTTTASNNSVLVAGESGSLWTNSGSLYFGLQGSCNSMMVTNGGTVANSGSGGYIGISSSSSNNSVLVAGTNSLWSTGPLALQGEYKDLYVGYYGSGNSLVISNGGTVANSNCFIGYSSSNNTVLATGPGSLWTNSGALYVGDAGSGNSLVITNGSTVASAVGTMGANGVSSNNTVLVAGAGSVWTNSGALTVGYEGSANRLVISNGGIVANTDGYIGYDGGSDNRGLVTGANSLWTNSGTLIVGNAGSGHGLGVVDGGTVAASNIIIASGPLSSGTLNIGRFGTNDLGGTIVSPTIAFGAGTGAINFNQSDAVTITSAISGVGTISQLGAGTTTLSGSNNYVGVTMVSAGALIINGDHSALTNSTNSVLVAGSAKLGGVGTIGGPTYIAGTHSPGSSPGVQTFLGDLTYSNTANFLWELAKNTDASDQRGIDFDGVDIGGTMTVEAGASTTLIFNGPSSTVDWSDSFWGGDRAWLAFSTSNTSLPNAPSVDSTWLDSQGNNLYALRPSASFAWSASIDGVYLKYSVNVSSGDWTYTLNASNEATITAYSGADGDVVIPATIDGYAVKVVGGGLSIFGEGNTTVNSVTMPNSVTSIGVSAFYGCTSLTRVLSLGDAPSDPGNAFSGISPVGTVYYLEGTTGWVETYGGWPTQMLPAFVGKLPDKGRDAVINNPAAHSLFTQSQYDTHHSNGVTQGVDIVLSNAASYGLYDSNSIMELNMGGVMVQKAGANAEVVLQLQTAEDLASGFTNNGPPITNSVPMNGNKGFMRIRALGNQ